MSTRKTRNANSDMKKAAKAAAEKEQPKPKALHLISGPSPRKMCIMLGW